jgi:DNA-binding NarL/FixJ family response regulator
MPSGRPRVLIADDHNLVAELCQKLLAREFDVVGVVSNGRDLVRVAAELRPNVVIVDVSMPVLNGLDAGEQVKKINPMIKLVYLTMNPDPQVAAEAFRRGASGYLLKTCATSDLLTAVSRVLMGKCYLSSRIPNDVVDFLQHQKAPVDEAARLTERQREVLQLLAEGQTMKEVGSVLNMATRTVAFHKYRIMQALGVKSSAELVRYAVRNHMVAA